MHSHLLMSQRQLWQKWKERQTKTATNLFTKNGSFASEAHEHEFIPCLSTKLYNNRNGRTILI